MSGQTSQGSHQRGGQPPEWNDALGPCGHQHLIKTPMLLLWQEELELLTSPTGHGRDPPILSQWFLWGAHLGHM